MTGKWALVIGASSGLGEAWANGCAKRGFNVIVCARRASKLQEVTKNIREKYEVETREFVCDISKEDAWQTIVDAVDDLDLGMVIYNAAIEGCGYFIKQDIANHRDILIGNALNPMHISYYLGRKMAKKHRGCILLVSSLGGDIGCMGNAAYSGTKAFMSILGECLWYEMAKFGVTFAGISVGSVMSPHLAALHERCGTGLEAFEIRKTLDYGFDLSEIDPATYSNTAHSPEEVAEYVLDHVEDGPRLFSHPEDQASYEAFGRTPRDKGIILMSKFTELYFENFTDFNAPDADEYVMIKN